MRKTIKTVFALSFATLLIGCSRESLPNKEQTGQNIGENQNSKITKFNQEASEKRQNEALGSSVDTKTKTPTNTTNESNKKTTMKLSELSALDYKDKYKSAEIETNMGNITVEFYGEDSPATVNNFMKLASEGFYDGIKFHRVMEDFMIQGGDPNSKNDDSPMSWGTGGPGYSFPDEFNSHKLVKGSLAMANSGSDTNGSQFFIVTKEETSWLDGKHTNFGFVTDGMDVVEKIENAPVNQTRPIEPIVINGITLIEK